MYAQASTTLEETDAGKDQMAKRRRARPTTLSKTEVAFSCFLIGCSVFLAYFCSVKTLSFDEMLSFYTENAPTAGGVLSIQRLTPVSIDPPLVHLLGHWSLALTPNVAFGVRLPSLVGSLVMMAGVFVFSRRLAGFHVAAFSVASLIVADNFHMVEARPYGVLLGAAALALLLWQNSIHQQHRAWSLPALFLVLGLAASSHYFGILLMVPFVLGEIFRIRTSRRVDLPLLTAVLSSSLFAVGWLPFLKGARQYKSNYYTRVRMSDLMTAYTEPFQRTAHVHSAPFQVSVSGVVVAAMLIGAVLGYKASKRTSRVLPVEWVVVVALGLLPIFGVVLSAVSSGAFETRYVLEFSIGLAIALSAGLMSLLRSEVAKSIILAACLLLALGTLLRSLEHDRAASARLDALASRIDPTCPTVLTDKTEFLWLHTYKASAPIARSVYWVADMQREIDASGSDNIDRTMLNLKQIAGLPVLSYNAMKAAQADFDLVQSSATSPPNWLPAQLIRDHAQISSPRLWNDGSFLSVHLPSN